MGKILDNEKENKTVDFLVELSSYLNIIENYIENNIENKELFHIGSIVENIQKELEKLKTYYDVIS